LRNTDSGRDDPARPSSEEEATAIRRNRPMRPPRRRDWAPRTWEARDARSPHARRLPSGVRLASRLALVRFATRSSRARRLAARDASNLQPTGLSKNLSRPPAPADLAPTHSAGRAARFRRPNRPCRFDPTFTGDRGNSTRSLADVNNPPGFFHEIVMEALASCDGSRARPVDHPS
jgi:hypothetical protein